MFQKYIFKLKNQALEDKTKASFFVSYEKDN